MVEKLNSYKLAEQFVLSIVCGIWQQRIDEATLERVVRKVLKALPENSIHGVITLQPDRETE